MNAAQKISMFNNIYGIIRALPEFFAGFANLLAYDILHWYFVVFMNLYFIHIFVAYMQKGDIVTWHTSQLWTKEKHIIPFTYHMATNHHAIQPC